MYLINKDETEHTGQVSPNCFIAINYYFDLLLRFPLTNTSQLFSASCVMLFYRPLFLHSLL